MNTIPHASWAEVYDLAYERTFGALYAQLTTATLDVIGGLYPEPVRIIDYGAGTGRLAIPLARVGHDVVAVDPCPAMLEQLVKKAPELGVVTACSSMSDFASSRPADFALGVFTVLLYILDEKELLASFSSARRALKRGGRMLVDVATPALFYGFERSDDVLTRRVTICPADTDRFHYEEYVSLRNPDGSETRFEDKFMIRRWGKDLVLNTARNAGFEVDSDLSDEFAGSGSNYFLLAAV